MGSAPIQLVLVNPRAVIMKRIKADMQLAIDIDQNKTMEGLNNNCAEMDKLKSKPEDSEEDTW